MLNCVVYKKGALLIAMFLIAFFISSLILNSYAYFAVVVIIVVLAILAIRFPLAFLIILFIINEKGFKTIDFGIPHWQYGDITLIILTFGLIAQMFRSLLKPKELSARIIRCDYIKYVLAILILVNVSTFIGGYLILGQPLLTLLFRTRNFYLYLIFIYLLMADFSFKDIKKFFMFGLLSTFCISILLVIDANLLGGGKIFRLAMSDGISGVRLGSVRIVANWFMAMWMYFYLLESIRSKNNTLKKSFHYIFIALISYQLIYINIIRQAIAQIFLATILFLRKTEPNFRAVSACCVGTVVALAVIIVLNNTELLKDNFLYRLIDTTLYEANQTQSGNIGLRISGIKYFFPYFIKSPLVGIGLLSSTYRNSPVAAGLAMGYNFADLGLFSIIYRFGLLSIVLIFFMLKKIFRDLRLSYARSGKEMRRIIDSILYLFIAMVVLVPSTTIFFKESECLYYGILLYFTYRIKKAAVCQE